jgi:hypothetical protein
MVPKNREIRSVCAQAVVILGFTVAVLLSGRVDLGHFVDLASTYFSASFAIWGLTGAAVIVVGLAQSARRASEKGGPVTYLADQLIERWHRDYFLSLLWPPILFAVLMTGFNAFKQLILVRHGFQFDDLFMHMDRILFLGHDPWVVTHALFGAPFVTLLIDHLYHGWYAPMALGVLICAWLPADSWKLRTQYLLTYTGIWIGLGAILASLLPAAGPVYYNDFVGNNLSFLAMVADLRRIDGLNELRALNLQEFLLSMQGSPDLTAGAGISAMPSVHNALAILFAIAAFRIHKALGWVMAAYAFVIWIGSIHLGWHYAIDGIASLVLTIALWKVCGVVTSWLETAPSLFNPAPGPRSLPTAR